MTSFALVIALCSSFCLKLPEPPAAPPAPPLVKGQVEEAWTLPAYAFAEHPVKEGRFIDANGLPYDLESAYVVNMLVYAKVLKLGYYSVPWGTGRLDLKKIDLATCEKDKIKIEKEKTKWLQIVLDAGKKSIEQPDKITPYERRLIDYKKGDVYKENPEFIRFICYCELFGKKYLEMRSHQMIIRKKESFDLFDKKLEDGEELLKERLAMKKIASDLHSMYTPFRSHAHQSYDYTMSRHVVVRVRENRGNNPRLTIDQTPWIATNGIAHSQMEFPLPFEKWAPKNDFIVMYPSNYCHAYNGMIYGKRVLPIMYSDETAAEIKLRQKIESEATLNIVKTLQKYRLGEKIASKLPGEFLKGHAFENCEVVGFSKGCELKVIDKRQILAGKENVTICMVRTALPQPVYAYQLKSNKAVETKRRVAENCYCYGWVLETDLEAK